MKCKHDHTRLTRKDGAVLRGLDPDYIRSGAEPCVLSARCEDCGVQLGLGESDERLYRVDVDAGRMLAKVAMFYDSDADLEMYIGSDGLWMSLASRDIGADGWPWDPSRPVVGQFEEHLDRQAELEVARDDAYASALASSMSNKDDVYHMINDTMDAVDDAERIADQHDVNCDKQVALEFPCNCSVQQVEPVGQAIADVVASMNDADAAAQLYGQRPTPDEPSGISGALSVDELHALALAGLDKASIDVEPEAPEWQDRVWKEADANSRVTGAIAGLSKDAEPAEGWDESVLAAVAAGQRETGGES